MCGDNGWLQIKLSHLQPLQNKQRRRQRERCSAPAELQKGTRDQGEETMKDRSPAGTESKSLQTDWSWDRCVCVCVYICVCVCVCVFSCALRVCFSCAASGKLTSKSVIKAIKR